MFYFNIMFDMLKVEDTKQFSFTEILLSKLFFDFPKHLTANKMCVTITMKARKNIVIWW